MIREWGVISCLAVCVWAFLVRPIPAHSGPSVGQPSLIPILPSSILAIFHPPSPSLSVCFPIIYRLMSGHDPPPSTLYPPLPDPLDHPSNHHPIPLP
jgi:hypothetical protein